MNAEYNFKIICVLALLCVVLVYFTHTSTLNEKFKSYKLLQFKTLSPDPVFSLSHLNDEIIIDHLSSNCECRKKQPIYITESSSASTSSNINVYMQSNESSINKLFSIDKASFMNITTTCDMYKVLRRGSKEQKVIGFSLYGQNAFYYNKIKNITVQIKKLFPDWLIRIHYDRSINKSIICEIECQKDDEQLSLLDNTDFCNINEMYLNFRDFKMKQNKFDASYIHSMKWRWFPIGDEGFVNVFSSRDIDTYVLQREVLVFFLKKGTIKVLAFNPKYANLVFRASNFNTSSFQNRFS
jgi:hypothetical protein